MQDGVRGLRRLPRRVEVSGVRIVTIPFYLTVVLLTCLLAAGCTSSSEPLDASRTTLDRILDDRQLRVGYIHYPPTAFRDASTGELRGHFVDAIEEIVRQLDPGIQITYVETTWADFTAALATGRVDLSIAGTFTTIPRAKVVAFTRPLVFLGRGAVVRRDDGRFLPDRGPEQFDRPDIRVAVVDGEGSHEFVLSNFDHLENVAVLSGSDLSQSLAAVSAGRADVGLSDAMETSKYAREHPEVVDLFEGQPYDVTPIAWAVRHGDHEWRQFLNTALSTLEAQGKMEQWESRYDYHWLRPWPQFEPR